MRTRICEEEHDFHFSVANLIRLKIGLSIRLLSTVATISNILFELQAAYPISLI